MRQITQPRHWTRPRNQAAGYQRPELADAVSNRTSGERSSTGPQKLNYTKAVPHAFANYGSYGETYGDVQDGEHNDDDDDCNS